MPVITNAKSYEALKTLAELEIPDAGSGQASPYLSISQEGKRFSLITGEPPLGTGFFDRLFGWHVKPSVDDLRDLKELYVKVLTKDIHWWDWSKYRDVVEKSMDNLRKLYELQRKDTSIASMAQKNEYWKRSPSRWEKLD